MWNTVKLKEIVNLDIGKTPARDNPKYWDKNKKSSNVWVSIRDMSAISGLYIGDSREYISNDGAKLFKEVPKNTLIMSFKLSIGKLAFTKINLRTNEAIAALRIKNETIICKEFLYYYLSSMNWDKIVGHDIKVKGKTLNKAKLKEILISLPPLIEQHRIVTKLDTVYAEINKAIKLTDVKIEKIEKLKATLLSLMLNSNIGKTVRLGDIIKTGAGGTPLKSKKEYYDGGKIKWLKSGAVCQQNISNSNTHITEKGLNESSAKLFPVDTVLVAMYGATAGQVGILRTVAATNQAVCGIYPSEKYTSEFLYYYILNYKDTLLKELSGVAQPNLSQIKIKNIPIPLISREEQKKIVMKIEKVFLEIKTQIKITNKFKEKFLILKHKILVQELQRDEAA